MRKLPADMLEKAEKSRLINWGKNIFLLFLGLVFSVVMLEVLLRIYNPLGFTIKGDRIILPTNKREVILQSSKINSKIVVSRNSLGFRGAEPPPDFEKWLTMVTIGGSTTVCGLHDDSKTWTHVLGEKLKQKFNHVWINNAGLAGHSTFGHSILIRDYILKLKPKIVIFLIGINDVGLDFGGQDDLNRFDKDADKRFTLRSFRSLDRFLASLSSYSEVSAALLNLKRYFFPQSPLVIGYQEIDFPKVPVLKNSEEFRSAMLRLHQEKYLMPFARRLQELINISRENSLDPVFLTQPLLNGNLKDEITGINLGEIKFRDNIDGETAWEILELYNATTRKIGKQNEALVIDLAGELSKTSQYFRDFVHYSDEGCEKVADIIYQHLWPYLARKYPLYLGP